MENQEQNTQDIFINQFDDDMMIFGASCHLNSKELNEKEANRLLAKSNLYLLQTSTMSVKNKQKLRCLQFWLAGFCCANKFKIYEENRLDFL